MLSLRAQSRLFFCGFIVSAAAACCGFYSVSASPKSVEAPSGDIKLAISEGAELERSKKWLDAIEHYKTLQRKFPDNEQINYGLRRSKIHFAIDRRYSDKSFYENMVTMSETDCFGLYEEILSYVHNSYIDKVNTTYFVAHGTESLYLALNNEKFLAYNLPKANPNDVRQFRNVLKTRYWNHPIETSGSERNLIVEVAKLAKQYTGLPAQIVIMEYVFGGFNSLDDYSSCMTPSKQQDMQNSIKGEFVGLGIEMKSEEGKGLLLANVLSDSPAEEGGLKPGDYVVGIGNVDCRNMTTEEAAGLLTGKSGSRVKLSWNRPKVSKTMSGEFARRQVNVKSIPLAYIIDDTNHVGYIRLQGFQQTTSTELDRALYQLQQEGMKSVILDLRGNPGGLLTAGVEVLDKFIDEGVLVSTRGREQQDNWQYSAHRLGTFKGDMVVLIDENSASASEMVAGGIRDHQRGQLIGRNSYGKWSVQSIFTISHSVGLRLSTAKFYAPKGGWYGKVGLAPDVEIEVEKDHILKINREDLAQDQDIIAALKILGESLYTKR